MLTSRPQMESRCFVNVVRTSDESENDDIGKLLRNMTHPLSAKNDATHLTPYRIKQANFMPFSRNFIFFRNMFVRKRLVTFHTIFTFKGRTKKCIILRKGEKLCVHFNAIASKRYISWGVKRCGTDTHKKWQEVTIVTKWNLGGIHVHSLDLLFHFAIIHPVRVWLKE